MTPPLTIAVAIATTGRRDSLTEVVAALAEQTRPADIVGLCPGKPEDVDRASLDLLPINLRYARAPMGLCAQRNGLFDALRPVDIIVFLDDDFLMAPDYLAQCEALFVARPEVVMVTGHVILDGILGPGLTMAEARAALAADVDPVIGPDMPVHNGYGCNMALRMAPVYASGLRFDEALPAYGWLEDVDFSRRLAAHGEIVKSDRCRGVHMGVKRGRSPGLRLGYSQISNPWYMWRKGTLSAPRAAAQMGRNILANMAGVFSPEPWVDRRGRARGNFIAIGDVLTGKVHPQRAMDLG